VLARADEAGRAIAAGVDGLVANAEKAGAEAARFANLGAGCGGRFFGRRAAGERGDGERERECEEEMRR